MEQFLTSNSFILKLLTQKHEVKNFHNIRLILENEEYFEVYMDYPELNFQTMWELFPHFIVVQCGEHVKTRESLNASEEALVLKPHCNEEKYDIFLIPAI